MYTVFPETAIAFTRPFVCHVGAGCGCTGTASAAPAVPNPSTATSTAADPLRLRRPSIESPPKARMTGHQHTGATGQVNPRDLPEFQSGSHQLGGLAS